MDDLIRTLQENCTGDCIKVSRIAIIPCFICEAADEIERLRAELKSQTFWAELLSRDKCYCVPEDIGMCMACAYRQTTRQNEEARRG